MTGRIRPSHAVATKQNCIFEFNFSFLRRRTSFLLPKISSSHFSAVTPLHVYSSIADIVMEEAPTTPTLAPPTTTLTRPTSGLTPPATTAVTPPPLPPPPPPPLPQAAQPERDSRRSGGGGGRMGLTKEVLSAHTQQEEQAFLDRFKDLSKLRVFDQTAQTTLRCQTPAANPLSRGRCTLLLPSV